jgi:hypothetical protein
MSNLHDTDQLDGRYLGTISSDFVRVADRLREVAYIIRQRGYYAYPVFIVSSTPVHLGPLLIDKEEMQNEWYYYATYLEALVQARLIAPDKQADFKNVYKNPDEFCCLLVIDLPQEIHKFISIPYPVD